MTRKEITVTTGRRVLLALIGALIFGTSAATQASVLYAVTGDGGSTSESLFKINKATGAATYFMGLGNGDDGEAIAFNPSNGRMYHASGNDTPVWESINLATPAVVTSIPFVISTDNEGLGLTWNPVTGTFLMSGLDITTFYSVTTAGVATDIGTTPEIVKGLAFVGTRLYAAAKGTGSSATGSNRLYELNPLNGALISSVGVTLGGVAVTGMTGLATDPDTNVLYAITNAPGAGNRHLITINPLTGVATDIGLLDGGSFGGSGWAGIAFAPDPVGAPEPATLLLFAAGLAGLRWRRRQA